jgi:hypothetical protein
MGMPGTNQKTHHKKGLVEWLRFGLGFKHQYSKQTNKKGQGVAQVVERLPNNCKALSSHPSTTQKRKINK